jgi:hypothetical protein
VLWLYKGQTHLRVISHKLNSTVLRADSARSSRARVRKVSQLASLHGPVLTLHDTEL